MKIILFDVYCYFKTWQLKSKDDVKTTALAIGELGAFLKLWILLAQFIVNFKNYL